jgi:hypothetical protein
VIFTFSVDNAKGADPIVIKLNNTSPIQFCKDPVLLAQTMTIDAAVDIQGMKISISQGYVAGEDELVYPGNLAQNNPSPGTLVLTGGQGVKDYVDAIRTITYKNNKAVPTLGVRMITISLSDVDYLPETGHFYRYVPDIGITWTDAKAKCDATVYYGLKGYLATITSEVENRFIQSKTKGVGWIGASDAAVEGVWRWVTGPESSEDMSGRLFWNGTGNDYTAGVPGSGPYQGRYNNWNSGEPNDCCDPKAHEEDYAHILYFANNPASSLKWNDLPNGGSGGEYTPQGYLIEFGGYAGEPQLDLSATLILQVNTMSFANKGIQGVLCQGDSLMLNKADTTRAVYTWAPADGSLSSLIIANPTAKPKVSSLYFVTGSRKACSDTATYRIPVNPKPIVSLGRDTTICNPANIILTTGTQFASYSWLPGEETSPDINVIKPGNYSVTVKDINGCKASAGIRVSFTDKPKIDFSRLNSLVCGKKSVILDITADKGSFSVERMSDGLIFNSLNITFPDYGQYDLKIKATDAYSCYSDSVVKVGFYETPTVSFDFDSLTCKGYNLPARYSGDADTIVSNFKWVFGGQTIADTIGRNFLVVPLGINRTQRDLQLTVTQDGCSNTYTQSNIKVIPNLNLQIINGLGCSPFNAEFKARNTEAVKYYWSFEDNSLFTEGDSIAFHLYQKAGFYDVKLKVTTVVTSGEGCTNEVKIDSMVHAAPIPDIAFSLSPDICLGTGINEISYTGTIGTVRDKYFWDLSQFDPSEIIIDPLLTQGPFKFDLKNKPIATIGLKMTSEFGCNSLPGSIQIKRKPNFSIQSDLLAGCIPLDVNLSGLISVNDIVDRVNFNWDFGDGTTGSGSPISHTYNTPAKSFNVILSGKSSVTGCENAVSSPDSLITFPKPTAKFSMDSKIIYNNQPDVKFTDLSLGATAWLWTFGEGSTSALPSPTFHFTKMGRQNVTLEVSNPEGCRDEISDTVLVAFDRLFPPNGFSPNAPEMSDREFKLYSDGISSDGYHLVVLSRWNDVVFETKNEIKGWDGRTPNGSFAPTGVYVWILTFTDFIGKKHQQTGSVTLVY